MDDIIDEIFDDIEHSRWDIAKTKLRQHFGTSKDDTIADLKAKLAIGEEVIDTYACDVLTNLVRNKTRRIDELKAKLAIAAEFIDGLSYGCSDCIHCAGTGTQKDYCSGIQRIANKAQQALSKIQESSDGCPQVRRYARGGADIS